ncbi:MAG: hypothetical protein R3B48_30370 [Kofleriaceae bacterium]
MNPPTSPRTLLALTLCAAALGLAACGTTTRFTALNPAPHPLQARPAASVQVFSTSLPSAPYTELGLIQGSQSSEFSNDDMPEIIGAMRKEAGKLGCDGLILNGVANKSTTVGNGANHGSHEHTLEGYWGTCIVFNGEPALAAAEPPAAAPLIVPPPAP